MEFINVLNKLVFVSGKAFKMLYSWVDSWPYPQTSDKAGKACRDKHSSFFQSFVNYGRKKFYNIGTWIPKFGSIPKFAEIN